MSPHTQTRAHFFILGRVQGVFFRSQTQKKAQQLKLGGWIRNLPDGRVEVVAEGGKEKIEELISWTKKSPTLARVSDLKIEWQEFKGEFNKFKIEY